MTLSAALGHPAAGSRATIASQEIVDRLDGIWRGDPDLSFQVAAFHDGALVLDAVGGPHLAADSVMVPFSVTKNTIGLTIGLLVERGVLDLDERVAALLAGVRREGQEAPSPCGSCCRTRRASRRRRRRSPGRSCSTTTPPPSGSPHSRPFWQPGSAFGYHAVTIGNLASELVFRVTGRTLHEFYEQEIRAPHDIDFFLGLPRGHEERLVPVLPMIRPVSDRRRRI